MRHFLGAEGEEVRKGDVYAAIKRLVGDSEPASLRNLMTRMERLSKLYSRIVGVDPEPEPELSSYLNHFRRLDFGSVYSLLLKLYDDYSDDQFSLQEFLGSIGTLHSFILRRMVVGVPSNSLSGLFISFCNSKPVTETPSAWLPEKLAQEDKNRRWPLDTEFAERWIGSQIYRSRACQVLLECLEASYGHHEIISFDESSIEHVMPQTLTPEWHEMLGPDATKTHAEWVYTIGNLTLTGYNPELGNRAYAEKRVTFASSHFELNRHFGGRERWTHVEIENRAKDLLKTAIKLWPRPAVAGPVPATRNSRERSTAAAFHRDCVNLAQRHLGVNMSKLSQTRYQSADGRIRLMCAVSGIHEESTDAPYFWFGFHPRQLDFLNAAESPYVCLGCASAKNPGGRSPAPAGR